MKKVFFLSFLLLSSSLFAQSSLTRINDPVVLHGIQLPAYLGLSPADIVAFKFDAGTWFQIPMQVDEKDLIDIVQPYGPLASQAGSPPSPSNPKILVYCDPNTHVGNDSDLSFDSDDELVFMLKDAGSQSDGSEPNGVLIGTCMELSITDPLGGSGYVYLFQNDGSLQQDAGQSYLSYSSDVMNTNGFPAHASGANPENTEISSSKYSWHFSAEWVSDEFRIMLGDNSDILDRYKNFFSNSTCGRHEDSFSNAENAFITVKSGPIRVIRSYMGANSGPLTQRTHLFYEGRQDVFTDLRVHNIPSIYDAFDYNSNANGMSYTNELNTTPIIIDGNQDVLNSGLPTWELITGNPGSISILHRVQTDMIVPTDGSFVNYYDDNDSNPASDCTGDGEAWSTSGVGIVFGNVCTDPIGGGCGINNANYRELQSQRFIYVDGPNAASNLAADYNTQFNNPIQIEANSCNGVAVNLKCFLEGALLSSSSLMRTSLNDVQLIPASQPYNLAPYNHTETIGNSILPLNLVDWVLIEARSGDPLSGNLMLEEAHAAFLLSDGSIVDPSGSGSVFFKNLDASKEYYFTIRHRNHLDIVTANSFNVNGGVVNYDFRVLNAYGTNQQKSINISGVPVFAMYAGDYNKDGVIQTTDFDDWKSNPAILNVYDLPDGNLDGIIQATDYDLWERNKSKNGTGLF